jgi:hypothetical protein
MKFYVVVVIHLKPNLIKKCIKKERSSRKVQAAVFFKG